MQTSNLQEKESIYDKSLEKDWNPYLNGVYYDLTLLVYEYLHIYLNKIWKHLSSNNNVTFIQIIWVYIPEGHYVSLGQIQIGAYDTVTYLNIVYKPFYFEKKWTWDSESIY